MNLLLSDRISKISGSVSIYSLLFFLLAFPLSVSASQILAGLCIFSFLFTLRENGPKLKPFLLPWSLVLGAYSFVFVSSLFHFQEYSHFWKTFTRQSEAGDFWLALIFPIAALHSSKEENQKRIRLFLWISFALLLITGIASVFSEFRLGKFISNGFHPAPGDRRQHPAGPLFGFQTYLPIGLMNTHLTYGGLLSFYIPGILILTLQAFREKKVPKILLLSTVSFLSLWVFLLNQSKSAWLGVAGVIGFISLNYWKAFKHLLSKIDLKRGLFAFLLILIALTSIRFFYQKNWLLQRTLSQLTEIQTPENQRYWIYKLSVPLLLKNPILGVGGGRFKETSTQEEAPLIQAQEQLWYELFITPNKHAHNDLLEFAIVGGWASAILWMGFFYLLFRRIEGARFETGSFPVLGIGFIWVAGFFQCYLLDDEVALPFFALAGILWGRITKKEPKISWFAISFPSITFLLNTGFWIWRLNTPFELAYARQIFADTSSYTRQLERRVLPFRTVPQERQTRLQERIEISAKEAGSEFSLEGCLTHRYPNPARRREEPYSLGFYVLPDSPNPPKKMQITIFSEESFDEDKLYWSHRKFDLSTEEIVLKPGWNSYVWKESLGLSKVTIFPDIAFFRSFKIRFADFDPQKPVQIPAIDLGDLCDFKF
ncbi:O-antigen ligase family protein [Leptospira langatensis]|uniref:O-antigen ligase family protein n=1 Tax=Leptospira langatensis TaxID=2484983 RepID=A0A5F1ZXX8_9LEPT|nr:O-antigen ligase family protein [Leptospira langatensis]TGJ98673.1 O-antigen ligase family protein [Leptospira langatensis]TGL43534.1 O-antigen ligase family protein [Leptospira langatensis]